MLAQNGNIDAPAPLARNGSGGGTLLEVPAPTLLSERARKSGSGSSDPARKSVSETGKGDIGMGAQDAGAARILRSLERLVSLSTIAARAARSELRGRPEADEVDDLQAYIGEEAEVVVLEEQQKDAEGALAAARADSAHKPPPVSIAATLLEEPGAAEAGAGSGSEVGGGGWQDGVHTPLQPNRTLRSRATDDVADGGCITSPSIRDAMVAAHRRRQGSTARAAPFVTDPYTEQRHLVSHAEGVVVLSQARQQLAQAVQRYPAISAALLEHCGGRDTPRPPLSDFPAAVVCEASQQVQLQDAVLRVLLASARAEAPGVGVFGVAAVAARGGQV